MEEKKTIEMEDDKNTGDETILFQLVGMLTSTAFQKSRLYIERLHKSFPNMFSKPILRPMLNVDWSQYLTKIRRTIGGKSLYSQKPVAIFINKKYIGDDDDLIEFIKKDFFFSITTNLEILTHRKLKDHIVKLTETGRRLAYLTIEIDNKYIGALLFLLYTDLVPITCNNFLRRCTRSRCTYENRPIHRIAKSGWIQGGGWNMKHVHMPCENYIVPHDRRGVLSMSNSEKHTNNSTQFIISLVPTPWMDYKYVAFGQLIQGEEVLYAIENVPTIYEYPSKNIRIVHCGEYSLDRTQTVPDKNVEEVESFLSTMPPDKLTGVFVNPQADLIHIGDAPSNVMLKDRYDKGLYSHELDFQSYANSNLQLPSQLLLDMETKLENEVKVYNAEISTNSDDADIEAEGEGDDTYSHIIDEDMWTDG